MADIDAPQAADAVEQALAVGVDDMHALGRDDDHRLGSRADAEALPGMDEMGAVLALQPAGVVSQWDIEGLRCGQSAACLGMCGDLRGGS